MWIHCKGKISVNMDRMSTTEALDRTDDHTIKFSGVGIVVWAFDTAEERDAVHQNICSQIGVTVQPGMVQYRIDWNGPTEAEALGPPPDPNFGMADPQRKYPEPRKDSSTGALF